MLLNHFITPTIIDGKQIKEKCSVEGCEHHSRNNGVCYQHGAIVDRCVLMDVIDRLRKEKSARSINRLLTFCLKRSVIVQDVPLMGAVTAPLEEGSVESMEKRKYSRGAVLMDVMNGLG